VESEDLLRQFSPPKSADNSATLWRHALPSITDRDEVLARHGDPEVGAIPLVKLDEILF